ncbi:myotubularin-related protein 9 isoform X1 [Harpia harpyja]|uniref:myotubularin-related protein 9 isoform X1 n=2 Tax=Harpia harpyja TaxID=202280 RepID=UPI0022B1DFB0|nr:myotubularin-related protein 9 isoform X1 [Harpia harpyja]
MEFAELIKTPRADNVVLHRPFYLAVEGTLCLTGHHLIFSSRRQDNAEELWLLHSNIDSVEKRFVGSLGTIIIKCKDLRIIQLDIPGMEECLNIASSIEALSTLDSVTLMYPFFYRPMFEIVEDGWRCFLPDEEFELLSSVTDEWRLSCINKEFSVCPSYPPVVIVPKSIDDEALRKVAMFRHGSRFPVLSYYHKKNGMVMMRSSQPLTGTNGRRCKEDEKLINATLRPGKRGYIIDTRSLNVAQQARAKGGGFEQEAHYPQWRRIHKCIERFNILQESLIKLVEACNDQSHNMDRWLSKLEASNWLTHVKEILTAACLAAQCIDREGASVLVHGTEGTDSTLQVTSLAQIILDPRCRTIRGFESLVVREWLQAGHPFQQRCAQSAYSNSKQKWEAPVFLLFLDCVWQILRQFPCSFEFNEQFLIILFEHAYASQFGTFLGNNENERSKLKLPQKTMSLWSWVNRSEELSKFENPLFEANSLVIWPSVAPQSLQLWEGVFLRWNRPSKFLDEAHEEMISIIKYNKELQAKVNALRRQLAQLETVDRMQENLRHTQLGIVSSLGSSSVSKLHTVSAEAGTLTSTQLYG